MYQDRAEWNDKFGEDEELSSMKTLTRGFYYTTSSCCLLIAVCLLVVFIKGNMIGATQPKDRISAIFYVCNNVIIPILVFQYLHFVIQADRTVNEMPIIGDKFFDDDFVSTFIAITVVMLSLTFLGVAGIFFESKIALETYTAIMALCCIGVTVQSAFCTYYAVDFEDYFN
jgi:hypothetical protein